MIPGKKILIVYTDAGGGHKATALAIKAVLERDTPHTVDIMNPYKELISDVDLFARYSPYTDEQVYNKFVLGKGWNNLFCLVYYALTLMNVRLGTRESVRRFTRCWKKRGVDLVISVMPMSNQGLYRSVKNIFTRGAVPFIVVITDLSETMKYTWFPKETDYFAVCATRQIQASVLAKPHPGEKAFHTGGLIVHPKFYDTRDIDPQKERGRLGLKPDRLTGCIMYGGAGSFRMAEIAQALAKSGSKTQIIFLCGRNQALADRLRQMALPYPHVIKTFTPRVPYYFSISDFLVGKPGPGTISEALVTGILPIVDAGFALPQERYNLSWLKQQGKGLSFKRIKTLTRIIRRLGDEGEIRAGRRQENIPENQAVFQMPEIVDTVFSACHAPHGLPSENTPESEA